MLREDAPGRNILSRQGEQKDTGTRKGETAKAISRISVRTLVEFLLQSGDIDRRTGQGGMDVEAALKGARIHRKIQKRQKDPDYEAEVRLTIDTEYDDLIVRVEGRADGVIRKSSGEVTVEEIKGMYLDVTHLEEPFPVHLAQAKCYACILAEEEALPEVHVRMTYVNLDSEEIQYFHFTYPHEELSAFFKELVDGWHLWAKWQMDHVRTRDRSMRNLPFPFPYREGQKALAAAVYHTIREREQLFLMAPTGVGKTMSCVYPAVRALGEGLAERIFYLTGKNETLAAGREAFAILKTRGLKAKVVQITSREKICPLSEPRCNPEDCPYAKGHFDRINDAVFDLLGQDIFFGREELLTQAAKWNVCPFELTLDAATWCDAVLCDYNYVFDPNAQLKRFFGNGIHGRNVFLIDEAHNLVDRGRQMYTSRLVKEHLLAAKRILSGKGQNKIVRALDRANRLMLELRHQTEAEPTGSVMGSPYKVLQIPEVQKIFDAAMTLFGTLQEFYEERADNALREQLLDFYFEIMEFVACIDALDENYVLYAGMTEGDSGRKAGGSRAESGVDEQRTGAGRKPEFALTLFCINPAARLTECMGDGNPSILFSATLLPLSYFKKLLTTREKPYAVYAKTPFLKEHRLLLISKDVSTVYSRRGEEMYRRIAAYIRRTAEAKTGNYLAFFPSYSMMREVFRIYRSEYDAPGVNWVMQAGAMRQDDREIFMENFYEDPKESLVGFAVMGGIFSEGIDLMGTRLIGAIVVGAGIPQVSVERELIKNAFGPEGFDYAYRCPGMNKIEQAAGRVIRTASDRGVILLLDDRLLRSDYRAFFPREWSDAGTCTLDTVSHQLQTFWT